MFKSPYEVSVFAICLIYNHIPPAFGAYASSFVIQINRFTVPEKHRTDSHIQLAAIKPIIDLESTEWLNLQIAELFFFLLPNHFHSDPGEAVQAGKVIIHPGALFAEVDLGDLAGAAVEEGIVQANFVADLEDGHLPDGSVLAQQIPGEFLVTASQRPLIVRVADPANDARDAAKLGEIRQGRFAEQEHVAGQQVVRRVDVFPLDPAALNDLRRKGAIRDTAELQLIRDRLALLGFAK